MRIPSTSQIWVYDVFSLVGPFVVFFVAKRVCEELLRSEQHPLRGWTGQAVRRTARGGFVRGGPPGPEERSRTRRRLACDRSRLLARPALARRRRRDRDRLRVSPLGWDARRGGVADE